MKIDWKLIVITLLLGVLVFQCSTRLPESEVKEVKAVAYKKIDGLNKVNDSLRQNIAGRTAERDSLQSVIDELKKQVVQLNKATDEKINGVDSFTVSELQQYFADRYRE